MHLPPFLPLPLLGAASLPTTCLATFTPHARPVTDNLWLIELPAGFRISYKG